MTNNALLERLMNDNQNEEVSMNDGSFNENEESQSSEIRIVTARYKVYTILIAILMFSIWTNYYPTLDRNYQGMISQKNSLNSEITSLNFEYQTLQQDEDFMNEILDNQETLMQCLNEEDESACENLPEAWQNDYAIPVSFSQITSLHSPRMIINEKKILKNLNEYLIHAWFNTGVDTKNGVINSIHIGEPDAENVEHIYTVPITFTIEFDTMDNLVSFVHNVERKLIETPLDRILYKIQSINYDIIESSEKQTSEIEMLAYYYYNPDYEEETFDHQSEIEEDE